MMKESAFSNSPAKAVIAVALLIMLIELLIMMLIEGILRTIQNDEPLVRNAFEFIDPILLTIIVSPALYFLIFKPMRAQQDELLHSHEQLRDANSVLEQRVLERTNELLATQEELTQKLQELRIAAVAFNTQEAILITDADANIVRVNQSFQEITGYAAEEVIGRNPRILNSGRHDKFFYEAIWGALRRERKWSGEIWNKRKNGEIYPEWSMITAIYTPDGKLTNYVGSFSDISLRKKTEEEIHLLAFYDSLTRLPNRRLLMDHLQKALIASARHGWHGALLFLDLDNFKTLNDTKGHNFGDAMLVEVACRLRNCVRGEDTVARLGGDEFVVLLENLGLDNQEAATRAETAGERMLVSLAQTYILNSHEHHASASIGVITFQGSTEAAEDLLKHADVAMYQAKSAGRNTLRFFDPSTQLALEARSAIEVDLHRALADGQFKLFYQAQVDVAGRLIGAEALIRWIHPQHGLISPLKFIPLAEETGLILPIGLWVLDAACAQLKQWESTPLACDLQLAVNVSARQFRQKDFVEQVHRVVGKSAIKPELLKLELTESLILDNVADAISKMRELKAIGIRFSMDDFGTGYSSLSYLKQLPLDQLKIDQSFVRDIVTDQNDAVIVQTIIVMAQNFHLNVIAEGVETKEQFEQLQQYGCQVFQGYLFSKPVPIEQFEIPLRQV